MSDPRLSTVYDFSTLRLRPDGSRVNQTSRNVGPRNARVAVQDFRGNWFARDAAGLGIVGRYRKIRDDAEGDQFDLEGDQSKRKGRTSRRYDRRPAKRRKFLDNLDFLEPPSLNKPGEQPLPSSDLLKCIHYFASKYYHERGHLFNASKLYRRMRKRNKLLKLEYQEEAQIVGEASRGDEETSPMGLVRRRKIKNTGKRAYRKDMYKVLDGSALMAIGMLLQEYVACLLEVRIPEGWEEEMLQCVHADSSDNEDIVKRDDEIGGDEAVYSDSSSEGIKAEGEDGTEHVFQTDRGSNSGNSGDNVEPDDSIVNNYSRNTSIGNVSR